MMYEGRLKFYEKLQNEFNLYRGMGMGRMEVLKALHEKYGLTITSIRNNIDTYSMEGEAYSKVKEIVKS